jgi:hypothetical protein
MQVECVQCSKYCENNRFQRSKYADLYVKETPGKGHGLFPEQPIPKDSFIMEYVGELVSSKEILRRLAETNKHQSTKKSHLYVMQLKANTFLDARSKGSISRFINHSCEPNCTIEMWTVGGHQRVGIFALRDIAAHEELSFDYQWRQSKKRLPTACMCGSMSCRGFIEVDVDTKSIDKDEEERSRPQGKWRSKADALELIQAEKADWLIGKMVRVYWDGNQEFFPATVMSMNEAPDIPDAERLFHCYYECDRTESPEKLLSPDIVWEWCDTTLRELSIKKKTTLTDEEEELEAIPIIPLREMSRPTNNIRSRHMQLCQPSSHTQSLPAISAGGLRVFKTIRRNVIQELLNLRATNGLMSFSGYLWKTFQLNTTVINEAVEKVDYAFTGTATAIEQVNLVTNNHPAVAADVNRNMTF